MPESLVKFAQVSKAFGPKQALHAIDFSIPSGQICGVVGPNGAGKTTLFRLLMGILRATEGSIHVDGRDALLPCVLLHMTYNAVVTWAA